MNRRDLFRGAGALALSAAMPAVVADPIYDEWTGLDLSSEPDRTAIWAISWGDGEALEIVHGNPAHNSRAFSGLTPR